MTDDNILTPLIMKFPNFDSPITNESYVSTLDIIPTILEYLGLEDFILPDIQLRGTSLLPAITNNEKSLKNLL